MKLLYDVLHIYKNNFTGTIHIFIYPWLSDCRYNDTQLDHHCDNQINATRWRCLRRIWIQLSWLNTDTFLMSCSYNRFSCTVLRQHYPFTKLQKSPTATMIRLHQIIQNSEGTWHIPDNQKCIGRHGYKGRSEYDVMMCPFVPFILEHYHTRPQKWVHLLTKSLGQKKRSPTVGLHFFGSGVSCQ